jgi:hypothetical protein
MVPKRVLNHFSHPFLGTYEVIQFLELANLEGTPFQSGMTSIPIPSYHGMETTYHTISYHTIPSHLIPYHMIPYHSTHTIPYHSTHTIPYHVIPYHHSNPVTGCLGSFSQNLKIISAGGNTGPLGSIFCGQVLQIFAVISSYKWRLCGECDPLKISSIGLYPRFWPFTLWIIHHRPLKIARPCNELNIHHK